LQPLGALWAIFGHTPRASRMTAKRGIHVVTPTSVGAEGGIQGFRRTFPNVSRFSISR